MNLQLARIGIAAVWAFFSLNALNAQCPEDMVSYWTLDESASTVYTDEAGGNNALGENAPVNVNGIIGNAKYFDGTKRVTAPSNAIYDFTNDQGFSIEFWVKFSDVDFGTYNKVFIGRNEPYATTGGKWWILAQMTSGTLGFYLEDSNGIGYEVQASAVNDNAWHHIVAVRNPADNTIRLYVDGSLRNSALASYSGNFGSSAPVQIGHLDRLGVPSYWYKGNLDEIAIHGTALSDDAILEHFTKGSLGIGYCDGYEPVIKSDPVLTAAVGQEYRYQVEASGMTPLTYELLESPAGMSINASTGLITWTPSSVEQDGSVHIRVSNDSYPPPAEQSYVISIAEAPSCPPGLAGLWKFDETSGPVYADYYGVHDAVAEVAPSPTAGIVNGAQLFDETTKVSLPDDGAWEWPKTVSFTLEAWIKTTNSASTIPQVVISRVRPDEYFSTWWLGIDQDEIATFYLRDALGTEGQISGGPSLADGQWHHIVGVRDENLDKNILYVDGVLVNELSINYPNSFGVDAADSVTVDVGWFNSGPQYHFVGSIDELAYFNRAVSASEVTQYYNSKNPEGHCAEGNYGPVILSDPLTTATQDMPYSYTFQTDDVDELDLLILNAPVKPSWLDFSHTLGQRYATLSGTPGNGNVGDTLVTLTVSDGEITKEQTFTLTVEDVNDAPVVTSSPVTSVDEDTEYSYTITAEDPEMDTVTVTVPVKPAFLSYDSGTLTLSGTPADEDVGDHPVSISVTDGTDSTTQDFTLTVVNVNDPPVITGQVTIQMTNSETYVLTLGDYTVEDPDNTYPDDFTLTVYDGDNYSVANTTIVPDAGFIGNLLVDVTVSDGQASSEVFTTIIGVLDANAAPVITGQSTLTVANDASLTLTLDDFTVVDADNTYPDDFTLIVHGGDHYTVDGTVVTPESGYVGNLNVGVQVNDGIASSSMYFALVEVTWPTGFEKDDLGTLVKVYPNPATSYVTFRFDESLTDATVDIISSTGVLVRQLKVDGSESTLDASGIGSGSFIYTVVKGDKVIRGTFSVIGQ